MAKWGEGDPRWIVEEREDAKNVNNWHWTEKNATQWSVNLIKSLLKGLKVEDDRFSCEVTEVCKCEGEAYANNRKCKLIFFYEWIIEADWKGKIKTGNNATEFKGKVEIPNLSEENSADELDVTITCESSTDDGHAVKDFMYHKGAEVIKQKLGRYIKELKEEYSKDLILPSKNLSEGKTPDPKNISASKLMKSAESVKPTVIASSNGTTTFEQIEVYDEFFCAQEDLFKVFLTEDLVRAFTRGQATVKAEIGGSFFLWSGNVQGKFMEIVPNSKIVMSWRRKNWPSDHHSVVTLNFETIDRGTRLRLIQQNVMTDEVENTKTGWKTNYFQAIKQTFGYGDGVF